MENRKKIIIASTFVGFSSLLIFGSFLYKENDGKNYSSNVLGYNKQNKKEINLTGSDFLKPFLKSDLYTYDINEAKNMVISFEKSINNSNYNDSELDEIKDSFLISINKYIEDGKVVDFKKNIDKETNYFKKNNTQNEILGKNTEENILNENIPETDKISLKDKFKTDLIQKYFEKIDKMPIEKLNTISEKIDKKIKEISYNKSLIDLNKKRILIKLDALKDIIDEKISDIKDNISIEELLS